MDDLNEKYVLSNNLSDTDLNADLIYSVFLFAILGKKRKN